MEACEARGISKHLPAGVTDEEAMVGAVQGGGGHVARLLRPVLAVALLPRHREPLGLFGGFGVRVSGFGFRGSGFASRASGFVALLVVGSRV